MSGFVSQMRITYEKVIKEKKIKDRLVGEEKFDTVCL